MNYPTAEQVRAALQIAFSETAVVTVSESSHGINGPVYAIAFSELPPQAEGVI